MNRRIVLIDEIETPNYMSYFGIGLGNEIYTIQTLRNYDEPTRLGILDIGEGDAVMLVGSEPFNYLKELYHYGVRSENYYDCSELPRLSIAGGSFAKVMVDFPSSEVINEFMSPEFCAVPDFSWFKSDIIHTYERALVFLNWIDSLPEDEWLGFDYEGSGFPLDIWYELSGFSLCNLYFGAFISLTDIRHELGVKDTETSTDERYNYLRKRLAEILYKRMSHILVYNMQYEYQASHRLLYYVDLYDLCDVSAINVITGHHLKKYSLKWSGQLYLKAKVWDHEFDLLSDLIDKMLFVEVGKLKKDKKKVLKVDQSNFEQTPEWAEICRLYPTYVDEFRSLILEYWGNPFMCIPSDILGKYCNLDAFYTLLIYKSQENNYSKECFDTFFDNFRLGTRLHTGGLYINEPYRLAYDNYCKKQMAFGIQYCATARCWMKMQKHKAKMADISKYHPVAIKLLKDGKFFQGNSLEIIKHILSSNIDPHGSTDTGLDEGSIALTYGFDFATALVDQVKIRMKEIKMKGKIDDGIIRKKKLLGLLAEDIKPMIGLDKMKLGEKLTELEKYSYYERNYNEMVRVSQTQLGDPDNIPEEVYAFGEKMSIYDYSQYILNNLFKCTSPEENDEIAYEYTQLFKPQTCFLASILESSQQLPEAEKFYSSRGISDINIAFQEYMNEGNNYYPNLTETKGWRGKITYSSSWHSALYPDKVFNLTVDHSKSMKTSKKVTKSGTTTIYELGDKIKEIWTDFNGFNAQSMFFPEVANQWKDYGKPFEPEDYNDAFFFMRKFVLMYLLFKKHSKMLTTYVGDTGMFNKTSTYVIEDENHIPIRYANEGEPGAIKKTFIKYQVNEKSSKRWSSGFHTIVAHSDIKNCLAVPPSWDENGNIVYGGGDYLMSYFDIELSVA